MQKQKRTATRAQMKKERDPKKMGKVIVQKGYKYGKLSKSKRLHHIVPVARKGKTTKKNTTVVTKAKHEQIHKNRKRQGKI